MFHSFKITVYYKMKLITGTLKTERSWNKKKKAMWRIKGRKKEKGGREEGGKCFLRNSPLWQRTGERKRGWYASSTKHNLSLLCPQRSTCLLGEHIQCCLWSIYEKLPQRGELSFQILPSAICLFNSMQNSVTAHNELFEEYMYWNIAHPLYEIQIWHQFYRFSDNLKSKETHKKDNLPLKKMLDYTTSSEAEANRAGTLRSTL